MQNVVEMRNISKVFPGVVANDNVDFTLRKGEIHVLLGENGAGKTTLMNILYGLYQQTSGEIFVNGEKVSIKNPTVAIRLGIGMVHQHFMLVNPFTVAENIVLGDEPKKNFGICLDSKKAVDIVQDLSNRFGLSVDPNAKIQNISVGTAQRVEILKVLYRGAEIIIFDEPTAVLTPQEIDELGVILKNLAKQGKSVVLITHKLKEILSMSDRVTVIRRGKLIQTVETKDTNADMLAEIMVGREVNLTANVQEKQSGDVILSINNLKVMDQRKSVAVNDVMLEVRAGEILAVAGVDGNGQRELVEALVGLTPVASGNITLCGHDITNKSVRKIRETGLSYIPEDRHKRGLVLAHSLLENMVLGYHYIKPFCKKGILDYNEINKHAKTLIKEFDVRTPSEMTKAKSLSGGNQQKVIIARELYTNPALLIASQPTRGLDVGAIEFVHKRLVEQRNQNKAVLLVSLELDEVMDLADRIAVIYQGKIVGIVNRKDANERMIGRMMAGKSIGEEKNNEESVN